MKAIAKFVIRCLAAAAVFPCVVVYWTTASLVGSVRTFPGYSQFFALVPGVTGVYLRRAFYHQILPRCGTDSWLGFASVLSHPAIRIGKGVYIGPFCCLGEVTLEDDVLLGSHVSISNGSAQHGTDRLDIPIREQPGVWPRVTIGPDTWIGDRAVVMADIGAHCVIGAGAVVTRPIPDYAIAIGVPARVVRYRNAPRHHHNEMPSHTTIARIKEAVL